MRMRLMKLICTYNTYIKLIYKFTPAIFHIRSYRIHVSIHYDRKGTPIQEQTQNKATQNTHNHKIEV